MRKILSFVEPTLQITYAELYDELAGYLETHRDDATTRFAPDEAVPALKYFRRRELRRQDASRLAGALGVPLDVVFEACTAQGAGKLMDAMATVAS